MIMSIISHVLSAWFAFFLPCFSTFKALSHRGPDSAAQLEKWAMYWSVIGAFVAFEYVAEWLICWLPFYWEAKTLFLLFLALPQTQGSTWVYSTYLQPFFTANETNLNAGIVAAQENTLAFIKSRFAGIWEFVWNRLNAVAPASAAPSSGTGQPSGAPAPRLSLQSAMGLWNTYGPAVMGALQPVAAKPASAPAPSSIYSSANASTTSFQSTSATVDQRVPQGPDQEPALPNPHPPFPQPEFH